MSMLDISDSISNIDTSKETSVSLLLTSIALEELALANIVHSEAEKIQFVLNMLHECDEHDTPISDALLDINKSVERMLRKVIMKEMLLSFMLEDTAGLENNNDTPVFGISLSQTETLEFDDAPEGYPDIDAATITVQNIGNLPTGSLTVELSYDGLFGLDKTDIDNIAVGKTDTFNIAPVTGLTIGTHTATVSVSGLQIPAKSFDVSFTVKQVMPTSITLNYTSLNLNQGQNRQLVATILPTNASDKSVTWTSSNPSYATVSSSGQVHAIREGTTTITATTVNGHSATCIVHVTED